MPAISVLLLPLSGALATGTAVGVIVLDADTRAHLGALLRTLAPEATRTLPPADRAAPVRVVLEPPSSYDPWAPDAVDAALACVVEGRAPALLLHHQEPTHVQERIDAWGGAAESDGACHASVQRSGDTVHWHFATDADAQWRTLPVPLVWLRMAIGYADAFAADHGA